MSTDNTLADLVEKMVAEKTFNLDALDAVRALKIKAQEQDKALTLATSNLASRTTEIASLNQRIRVLETEFRQLDIREAAVAEREKTVTQLEKNEAVARAQADTLRDVFGTIFKNTTVRENNLKALPFTHVNNGQSHSGYSGHRETVERTID